MQTDRFEQQTVGDGRRPLEVLLRQPREAPIASGLVDVFISLSLDATVNFL